MFHTVQSAVVYSACPSGGVWWSQAWAVTISFIPLPVIGRSGMNHIGGRPTTITYLRPLL
jgi:hypothetical protein